LVMPSRPLQRTQSLHEQTYQTLRAAILSGEISAGTRLVETQLAEQLQVSRTPIREAFRQLQRENLVLPDSTNGGMRVATLSVADAMQLYDCRIALEQLAVTEACGHITEAQLKAIDQAIQQAEQALAQPSPSTGVQLLHLDYQFHRLLAEGSGNSWLVQMLDQVFDKMSLLRLRTLEHNPDVLDIRSEHRRILEAVCDRAPIEAAQAVHAHLTASKARVVQEIRQLERRG
jgi:DNA-binding GntR family transcriptional regulator